MTEPRRSPRTSRRAPPDGPDPRALETRLVAPVRAADVEGLCAWVRDEGARSGPRDVACDVEGLGKGDLGAINGLARLALAAHRAGGHLRLDGSTPELRELIEFVGLDRVLPCAPAQPSDRSGLPSASSRSGRPKSGKKRAVSRKKVTPDSRSSPPPMSITWRDQGS